MQSVTCTKLPVKCQNQNNMEDKQNQGRKNYQKGIWAEYLAVWYLRLKGYHILKVRYKTKWGEIDIIAKRRHVICFVEVKKRKNKDDARYAITLKNRQRVEKSALKYLSDTVQDQNNMLRFDVICFSAGLSWPDHIENAWQTQT